jgi:hypothetical protein
VQLSLSAIDTELDNKPISWSVYDIGQRLCQEGSRLPETLDVHALAEAFKVYKVTGYTLLYYINSEVLRDGE